MLAPSDALGELWGLTEADPLVLGVVVAALLGFALVYVLVRLKRSRGRSTTQKKS